MTSVPLFVNGGGMRGGNVHHSIEGLPFLGEARTAPRYRFFSIRDEFPGLWPVAEGGVSVPGELYDVPLDVIRDRFIPAEPPELELSVIEMDDGSSAVAVVLREVAHQAGTGLIDISETGGWRAFFKLDAPPSLKLLEMTCDLSYNKQPFSERWTYQWTR